MSGGLDLFKVKPEPIASFGTFAEADGWRREQGYVPRHGGGYERGGRWIEIVREGDVLVVRPGA